MKSVLSVASRAARKRECASGAVRARRRGMRRGRARRTWRRLPGSDKDRIAQIPIIRKKRTHSLSGGGVRRPGWSRLHERSRMHSSMIWAQPFPTSTIRRMIVSRCVSVTRSVDRIGLPSTRAPMICVQRARESWFMATLLTESFVRSLSLRFTKKSCSVCRLWVQLGLTIAMGGHNEPKDRRHADTPFPSRKGRVSVGGRAFRNRLIGLDARAAAPSGNSGT